MKPKLIILRHAHRDKSHGDDADNGLSTRGKEQAKKIAEYFEKKFGPKETTLLTSPKKRCQQTLEPLSKYLKVPVIIRPDLDEQQSSESWKQFDNRVKGLCDEWQFDPKEGITVWCSHGDWIPVALDYLIHAPLSLKKGAWVELGIKNNSPELIALLQEPEA